MDTLLKALQADGIPYPSQNVDSGRYTRWGRSKEYYAIRLSDGSEYRCFTLESIINAFPFPINFGF